MQNATWQNHSQIELPASGVRIVINTKGRSANISIGRPIGDTGVDRYFPIIDDDSGSEIARGINEANERIRQHQMQWDADRALREAQRVKPAQVREKPRENVGLRELARRDAAAKGVDVSEVKEAQKARKKPQRDHSAADRERGLRTKGSKK